MKDEVFPVSPECNLIKWNIEVIFMYEVQTLNVLILSRFSIKFVPEVQCLYVTHNTLRPH